MRPLPSQSKDKLRLTFATYYAAKCFVAPSLRRMRPRRLSDTSRHELTNSMFASRAARSRLLTVLPQPQQLCVRWQGQRSHHLDIPRRGRAALQPQRLHPVPFIQSSLWPARALPSPALFIRPSRLSLLSQGQTQICAPSPPHRLLLCCCSVGICDRDGLRPVVPGADVRDEAQASLEGSPRLHPRLRSSTPFPALHLRCRCLPIRPHPHGARNVRTPPQALCMSWTSDGQSLAIGTFDGIISIRDRVGAEIARRPPLALSPPWDPALCAHLIRSGRP